MSLFADTPEPPYTVVVFSSVRRTGDAADNAANDLAYERMSAHMFALVTEQPGYLGFEAAHEAGGLGITLSYWVDEAAAVSWKQVAEHLVAQERGRNVWYAEYRVRIATVTRSYGGPGA